MFGNSNLDTWRGWLELAETLTNDKLINVTHNRKIDGEPFGPLAAPRDVACFKRAAQFVLFERSRPWPSDRADHTEECLKGYAADLDIAEKWQAELDEYRAAWGKTYCKACGGTGMLPGYPGTYWEPPTPPEPCEECLAHMVQSVEQDEYGAVFVNDPICPRCGNHTIPMSLLESNDSKGACLACGWTLADSGIPEGPDYGQECICPDAY